MGKLQDKVAIITGGANGIGKATVTKFLSDGAKVAIWDINEEKGKSTLEELNAGDRVRFYAVNTTDMKGVEAAAKQVAEDFGRIDILINNAGITRDSSLKKMTQEQWQQVIDVNLSGVFYCTHAVYPYMAAQQYGRIVTASSVVGLYGNFGQTNYAATKAGVIAMTKVWAREFGRKNITANAVAPGFIHTEMMDTIPENVLDGLRAKTPLQRLGKVEEVANLYAFLASDESPFITGAVFSIDGGVTL
jgi:3-oxoacyl-[acyl-carrier protein] reductase